MKNLQKVSIVDLDEASQWGVSEWEGGKKIVFVNFSFVCSSWSIVIPFAKILKISDYVIGVYG